MGKGLAILGLLLIIVGILPIILPMIAGFEAYAAYFYLGYYTLPLAGYEFSELMLILLGVGVLFLIIGAIK
ncbi:MAG: hypothetical protein ACTSSE_08815 [Candidatus Thorarchaeota archaeon]